MQFENLTLRQKIMQMFITGFNGESYLKNEYFAALLKEGLGGVIFFTHNIKSEEQIKSLIREINDNSYIPMFISIDQEGGRVERTENIYNGKKYLSAKYAYKKGIDFLKNQTKVMAAELKAYGFNMNFAPVLDVNTNKDNPIIGERSFSDNPNNVIEAMEVVLEEYLKQGIITVGKHFPGHGAANADSHKTLPIIDIDAEEMRNTHIAPFLKAINMGIPAVMVAHVLYPILESDNIPASVSKRIITDILIKELHFDGVIITDDMEMNGIKGFTKPDACIKAINSGINMFIYRDTTKEIINLIDDIEKAVINKIIDENNINNSVRKILKLKYRYGLIPM